MPFYVLTLIPYHPTREKRSTLKGRKSYLCFGLLNKKKKL